MIDPNGADDYYNKKGKYLGSDGIGTAVRLMDIDALQDKVDFEVFMDATKEGGIDVIELRSGISRVITFKNDGHIYEKMYSDSRDGAERSASIVLDPVNAEVYVTDVQKGKVSSNSAPFRPSGTTVKGSLVLGNIHTHQQEENYMESTDMELFESQYRNKFSDGENTNKSQTHIYSIGRDNINYYSPEGKEKSSNNVGSRRALDSGKLKIGKHVLEKYGKHEKK